MAKGLYANIHAKRKRIAAGSGDECAKLGLKVHRLRSSFDVLLRLQRNVNRVASIFYRTRSILDSFQLGDSDKIFSQIVLAAHALH